MRNSVLSDFPLQNTNKFFEPVPFAGNLLTIKSGAFDWFTTRSLARKVRQISAQPIVVNLTRELSRHIYNTRCKKSFLHYLCLIDAALDDRLLYQGKSRILSMDEKIAVCVKIVEEISECTPGYANRIQSIVSGLARGESM